MNDESGWGVEPSEAHAVWEVLIGEQEPGDDDLAWFFHLSSRDALIKAVATRIADARAQVAAKIYDEMDEGSYSRLAALLSVSRGRAQQLVERSRTLRESGRR